MKSVAVITTVNHNVGDDFVREGILYLLEQMLGPFEIKLIHKHIPVTVRPEWEWVYTSGLTKLLDRLPRGRGLLLSRILDILPLNLSSDKILTSDILVQSGAPAYWLFSDGHGSHTPEWFGPLIRRRYLRVRDRIPFLNIGVGACQPYWSDGREFLRSEDFVSFVKEYFDAALVTTVRDQMSKNLLNWLGFDAPLIPCPSIFACDRYGFSGCEGSYVVLNFMPFGGHFALGQSINGQRWKATFSEFYRQLRQLERVVLVCHDRKEEALAREIAHGGDIFFAQTAQEYLEFYSRAKMFLGCRVHGAFVTAGYGHPSFVVGSDSRARMMDQIGLKSKFVENVTHDDLLDEYERLKRLIPEYPKIMNNIKQEAFEKYMTAFSAVMSAEGQSKVGLEVQWR